MVGRARARSGGGTIHRERERLLRLINQLHSFHLWALGFSSAPFVLLPPLFVRRYSSRSDQINFSIDSRFSYPPPRFSRFDSPLLLALTHSRHSLRARVSLFFHSLSCTLKLCLVVSVRASFRDFRLPLKCNSSPD